MLNKLNLGENPFSPCHMKTAISRMITRMIVSMLSPNTILDPCGNFPFFQSKKALIRAAALSKIRIR